MSAVNTPESDLNGVAAIVIGASAGALGALSVVLPALPSEFPLPLFIVVHQPPDKFSMLPDIFRTKCALCVKEAEDKEPIAPGAIYFAPPNYHLLIEKNRVLSLSSDEPVNFSRPAIDVLFESAADVYSAALLGIILTGANHDGAKGLNAVCAAGGRAWVQSPDSAESRAMPEAALAACKSARPLALPEMARLLKSIVPGQK